jgi:hypothetical protein
LVALRERAVSDRRNAVCRRYVGAVDQRAAHKTEGALDKAVVPLLTTTDAVKLQRAMFLICRLDCKISTRL